MASGPASSISWIFSGGRGGLVAIGDGFVGVGLEGFGDVDSTAGVGGIDAL